MMTGISGCAASGNHQDTSSSITESGVKASRTPEEAAVEAQFEPLFEFLAAEKKDFSKIDTFVSDLRVRENGDTNIILEESSLLLKISGENDSKFSGYFVERLNDTEVQHSVSLNSEGELIFEESKSEKFVRELYFVNVAPNDIKKGTVVSYSMNHSETDLETLTYELDKRLPLFKAVQDSFDIQEPIVSARLSLSNQGGKEFDAVFTLVTENRSYSLGTLIIFEE